MKFDYKWLIWILEIVTVILLAFHTYQNDFVSDYVSIMLLLLMALMPLIPKLKFFRYGSFEAQIGEAEVDRLAEGTKVLPEIKQPLDPFEDFDNHIYQLGFHNLNAAIMALRIEFEKVMKELHSIYKIKRPYKSYNTTLTYLIKKKVIEKDAAEIGIRPYFVLFNRISHGEPLSLEDEKDWDSLARSSVRVLQYLYSLIEETKKSKK